VDVIVFWKKNKKIGNGNEVDLKWGPVYCDVLDIIVISLKKVENGDEVYFYLKLKGRLGKRLFSKNLTCWCKVSLN